MSGRRRFFVTAAAALAASVVFLGRDLPAAGQGPLPEARDIVARHVTAIGGAPAFAAVSSIRLRGRLEIPAQKIAGDLEVLSARPNRMLYRVTVPGIGRIENGYDGAVGWSISPVAGPELLAGRQLTEAADDAWFDAPLHAPSHVRELTTVARTQFDGREAFKLRVVFASGSEQMEYFDVATGLQIGSEAARATPQGVVQTVNILRDYRKCGALMHAGTFVQRALGFEQVVTLTSCEYNVVPVSAFEPPAEVKALANR
jgi:hypothetical protein